MARNLNKLSDRRAKTETTPGRHSDGGGLYLEVKTTGFRSWLFMWKTNGKRSALGLGPYPAVSLAKAREKAEAARKSVAAGGNPLAESRKEEAEANPTFAEAANLFLADNKPAWRNEKHKLQWEMTLGDAYCRHLRRMRVSEIGTEDVLVVLKPIWLSKAETASRVRGRIERVLAFAKVKGWRSGENSAAWRGHLDALLPKRTKLQRGHHKAMPFVGVPAFVQRLRDAPGLDARALEFVILTAARSGEAVGAKWSEIDLEAALWVVPKERMKAGREHEVPLSPRAVEVLKALAELRRIDDFVFPGQRHGRPLSSGSMEMLLRRLEVKHHATIHGFRSSFRDWAGDQTTFPREVAEAALAHRVGGVEGAYRRGSALEKRRKLMAAWAEYLAGGGARGKVVLLISTES